MAPKKKPEHKEGKITTFFNVIKPALLSKFGSSPKRKNSADESDLDLPEAKRVKDASTSSFVTPFLADAASVNKENVDPNPEPEAVLAAKAGFMERYLREFDTFSFEDGEPGARLSTAMVGRPSEEQGNSPGPLIVQLPKGAPTPIASSSGDQQARSALPSGSHSAIHPDDNEEDSARLPHAPRKRVRHIIHDSSFGGEELEEQKASSTSTTTKLTSVVKKLVKRPLTPAQDVNSDKEDHPSPPKKARVVTPATKAAVSSSSSKTPSLAASSSTRKKAAALSIPTIASSSSNKENVEAVATRNDKVSVPIDPCVVCGYQKRARRIYGFTNENKTYGEAILQRPLVKGEQWCSRCRGRFAAATTRGSLFGLLNEAQNRAATDKGNYESAILGAPLGFTIITFLHKNHLQNNLVPCEVTDDLTVIRCNTSMHEPDIAVGCIDHKLNVVRAIVSKEGNSTLALVDHFRQVLEERGVDLSTSEGQAELERIWYNTGAYIVQESPKTPSWWNDKHQERFDRQRKKWKKFGRLWLPLYLKTRERLQSTRPEDLPGGVPLNARKLDSSAREYTHTELADKFRSLLTKYHFYDEITLEEIVDDRRGSRVEKLAKLVIDHVHPHEALNIQPSARGAIDSILNLMLWGPENVVLRRAPNGAADSKIAIVVKIMRKANNTVVDPWGTKLGQVMLTMAADERNVPHLLAAEKLYAGKKTVLLSRDRSFLDKIKELSPKAYELYTDRKRPLPSFVQESQLVADSWLTKEKLQVLLQTTTPVDPLRRIRWYFDIPALEKDAQECNDDDDGNSDDCFFCEVCSKSFSLKNSLQRHMKTIHAEERPLQFCSDCSQVFSDKSSVIVHWKVTHDKGPGKYPCLEPGCSSLTPFKSSRQLADHREKNHEDKEKCEFCQKTFGVKRSLRDHLKYDKCLYLRAKRLGLPTPVRCANCDKIFMEQPQLTKHEEVCGERLYCSNAHCNWTTTNAGSLRKHSYKCLPLKKSK